MVDGEGNDEFEGLAPEGQPDTSEVTSGESQGGSAQEPTQEWFNELERKTSDGYEPTEVEWEMFEKFQDSKNGTPATEDDDGEVTEGAGKESSKPEKEPEDNSTNEEKALKILQDVHPNDWTKEQLDAVNQAMKSVGAKSPLELEEKIKGLASLAGKKGNEAGSLRSELEALKARAENAEALISDALAGKPEALSYLRLHPNALAQAEAAVGKSGKEADEADEDDEDEVLDPVTFRKVISLQKKIEEMDEKHARELEEYRSHQAEVNASRERESAREFVTSNVLELADKYPEDYKVEGLNMREQMRRHFEGEAVDPRMGRVLETLNLVREKGFRSLEDAHAVRMFNRLPQLLLESQKRGESAVLGKTATPSISNIRNTVGEVEKGQKFSERDIQDMIDDKRPMPDDWFDDDDQLVISRLPEVARRMLNR